MAGWRCGERGGAGVTELPVVGSANPTGSIRSAIARLTRSVAAETQSATPRWSGVYPRNCSRCGANLHPTDPPHLCKDVRGRLNAYRNDRRQHLRSLIRRHAEREAAGAFWPKLLSFDNAAYLTRADECPRYLGDGAVPSDPSQSRHMWGYPHPTDLGLYAR